MTALPSLASLTTAEVATVLGSDATRVPALRSVWAGARAAGLACTVRVPPGDNLGLHHALAVVRPGEILVADAGGDEAVGVWGALMTIAAQSSRVAGLVVNGSVRDVAEIRERVFPVFAIGTAPHAATKDQPGAVGVPIEIRGVPVEPGDLIVADDDAVVVVSAHRVRDLADDVAALRRKELEAARRLASGETTVDVLRLRR
jgi:4-hydroxy-4-methyl-2-oxoglutarate aldolase